MTSKALDLFKLGRPLTSLLGALSIFAASFVGAGLSLGAYWLVVLLGAAIGYLFTTASNALNDYFDIEIDRINHPERPIPSGKISPRAAYFFSMIMFSVSTVFSLLLCTLAGIQTFVVVIFALSVQLAYDLKVKKVKVIGNIFIGFQTVLAFLFGGLIVNNINRVAFMALASFLAITAREVVKDVEDIKGDVDKSSLPKIIGVNRANGIALILISSAIALSVIAYYPLQVFGLGYFIAVLVADSLFIYSMPLLFKNPNSARKMWKYAMLIALISFIIGAIF